ncbi:SsrA-binding protein SmpB [Kushneria phosphatilytica]|uniref:SsrA-binding protein n=1 Tax=Kushneria phosphatilytica TaxID=657387 RepID=A0A1S1NZK2_9GAMM|nr:SsrA-binding protein SmpB [Kushneria phosphatilytica]OHV11215.1 SsrA-binding protein [Kushneria phosphatilytica]QEL12213.1 SsrA-binding protein SmpB [Kushneria phosphatilytica]
MGKKKDKAQGGNLIAQNRKARHEYFIEETFEAGVALSGWEVKSLRAGRCQLVDTYILVRRGEAWLLGTHITPLSTASTHTAVEPDRTRKLLLHKKEIARIFSRTQDKGHTCVPLRLYWKGPLVKCELALVVGKQQHDKRDTEKKRDWERQKARIMRSPR